mmetsp:Transcript_6055/g.7508  ORF Transcript_6055/g.7508 Transcript_6055/m.7508 type:complete len:293 (-) Transcript_6055:796-1674(-)
MDLILEKQLPASQTERTCATYYRSLMYTDNLTPEFIADHKPNTIPKNGQMHWRTARWTTYDCWYMTNNWIHKVNDRRQFALFDGYHGGLNSVTCDDQPCKWDFMTRKRYYEDDIIGQTVGAMIVGCQLGISFGILQTFNTAKEAGIFQAMGMPQNRWLPLNKVTWRFKARIFGNCMAQASTYLGAYAFVEACMSSFRRTDDLWNPMVGGFASGLVAYAWFRNPHQNIPLGCIFGMQMALFRFGLLPEDCKKLALDFDRPFWGVFGGVNMWLNNEEPLPDKLQYQWWDSKYRL